MLVINQKYPWISVVIFCNNVDGWQCLACPDILAIKVANGSWMSTLWTWGIFPFHYIEEQLASCKRVLDPVYSITFPELLCSCDRGDKPYREQYHILWFFRLQHYSPKNTFLVFYLSRTIWNLSFGKKYLNNVDGWKCLACPDILAIKVANGSWMFTMWTWGIFPFHYIEEQLASCKRVLDPVYSITFSELLCSSDRGDKPYREQCQYL